MHPTPWPATIGSAAQTRSRERVVDEFAGDVAAAAAATFTAAEGDGDMQATLRRRSSGMPTDLDDEVVQFRRVPEGGDSVRELRISCPDATGLGCDITRMLLDFGLGLLSGDMSTDGDWCYLVFMVELTPGMPPHWELLKRRLEGVCPHPTGSKLWRWNSNPEDFEHPFMLQVSSYDRVGVLHDLMHTLWEADVSVFKAHITTNPASDVLDTFWIYDNRHELPQTHRVLEICDQVRQILNQPNSQCTIESAPPESVKNDSPAAIAKRCLCSDAAPISPLRSLSSKRLYEGGSCSSQVSAAHSSGMLASASPEDSGSDEYGPQESVTVEIDNTTTAAYSVVSVVCRDRKGLVYDLMRTMKDLEVRVAYGRIAVLAGGMCEADLFVQEANGMRRIQDACLLKELQERVRLAIALPVRIAVIDIFDDTCTQLLISAPIDSGGRGRPRVTYDVTAALNAIGVCVFNADVYVEPPEEMEVGLERRPQELHRFLVHLSDGCRLSTEEQKRAVYEQVHLQLLGISPGVRHPVLPLPLDGAVAPPSDSKSLITSLSNWKWSS